MTRYLDDDELAAAANTGHEPEPGFSCDQEVQDRAPKVRGAVVGQPERNPDVLSVDQHIGKGCLGTETRGPEPAAGVAVQVGNQVGGRPSWT